MNPAWRIEGRSLDPQGDRTTRTRVEPGTRFLQSSLRPRACAARRSAGVPLLVTVSGFALLVTAQAQVDYHLSKTFTSQGSNPTALIEGTDHVLYGTMREGGRKWEGVVFKINKDGSGYSALHDFPDTEGDGQNPSASVVQGSDGAVYGMTKTCSTDRFATLFRLSPPGSQSAPAPATR